MRKILLLFQQKTNYTVLATISIILILFYLPVWKDGKVPLNGNFLVSFYAPWKFEKIEGFPFGVPAKQGGGYDTLRLGFPYFGLVHDSWKNRQIPLWNPYNFSGLPLAAESQSASFYPLQFLSTLFSTVDLWTIITISGYFLCFLFTYYYFLFHTKNIFGSIFGAFTFTFSTFFIAWNQEVVTAIHAAMWLPLLLLCIDKLMLRFSLRWFLFFLVSGILSILSGYIQITFYLFAISFLYSLWQVVTVNNSIIRKLYSLGWVITGIALSMLLTSFQLLPLAEMHALSSREIVDMKAFLLQSLMPIYAPIQLLIPEFFGSSGTWNFYGLREGGTFYERTFSTATIPLIFAVFSLFAKTKEKNKIFFSLLGVIALLLSLNIPISRWIYSVHIPLLSTSVAGRLLFIPAFCIAYLASIGIKNWTGIFTRRLFMSVLLTLLIFLSLYGGVFRWVFDAKAKNIIPPNFLYEHWTDIAVRNSIMPIGIFSITIILLIISFFSEKSKKIILLVFFILSLAQMGYFFQKVTAFSDRNLVYPEAAIFSYLKKNAALYRFWSFGDASIENNIASQMRLYTSEGYDSLANRRFSQLLKTAETNGRWTNQLSRSDVGIYKGNSPYQFMNNTARLKILALTSTKYILYRNPKDAPQNIIEKNKLFSPQFHLENEINGIQIYSYNDVLPRVLFISTAITVKNDQNIITMMFDPNFDLKKTIILEKEANFQTKPDPKSEVSIYDYQPNRIILHANTDTAQWLLLTDSYYPGWHASIDGKYTQIYRADFALRALPVEAGKHIIALTYWPESFANGLGISIITAIALISIVYKHKLKQKSKTNNE